MGIIRYADYRSLIFNFIKKEVDMNNTKELWYQPNVQSQNGDTIWTKLGLWSWALVNETLFKWSPVPCYAFRASLLKLWGAKIGKKCCINNTVKILYPWRLHLEEHISIDRFVIIHNPSHVYIDSHVGISTSVQMILGGHDIRSRGFEFQDKSLHIGAGAFIGGGSLLRGVNIGQFACIGAGSMVIKDVPENTVAFGWPAEIKGDRLPEEEYNKYRYK